MTTQSEKAAKVIAREIESATSWDVMFGDEQIAIMVKHIDTALNEARLEGAKSMQAKCAEVWGLSKVMADNIRALDPQQVINEGVK